MVADTTQVVEREQPILKVINWSDNAVPIGSLQATRSFPQVIRMVGEREPFFLYGFKKMGRVLAEPTGISRTKRISGRTFMSLPLTYKGMFEVVSEDGRAAPQLRSVAELAQRAPQSVLVRTTIRAYNRAPDGTPMLSEPEPIQVGEVLDLVTRESMVDHATGMTRRFLRIRMRACGTNMFLDLNDRGRFTPVADEVSIVGAHELKGIIGKFRLPVKVQLTHGKMPALDPRVFNGNMRLVTAYEENSVFYCALNRKLRMKVMPVKSNIKVQYATNISQLQHLEEFEYMERKSASLMENYLNYIHVSRSLPPDVRFSKTTGSLVPAHKPIPEPKIQARLVPISHTTRRGDTSSTTMRNAVPKAMTRRPFSVPPNPTNNTDHPVYIPSSVAKEQELLYREVDDVYAYVRKGGTPPPQQQIRNAVLQDFASTGQMRPVERDDEQAEHIYSSMRFKSSSGKRSGLEVFDSGDSGFAPSVHDSQNSTAAKKYTKNPDQDLDAMYSLYNSTNSINSAPLFSSEGSIALSTMGRSSGKKALTVLSKKGGYHSVGTRHREVGGTRRALERMKF